jgi:hypothetical protein
MPEEHCAFPEQAFAHFPQFETSLVKSTHAPAQSVNPAAQVS